MKASEWIKALPPKPGEERERAIVEAVERQAIVHDWWPLTLTTRDGRTLIVNVSRHALRVGEPDDSIRVSMTCRSQAAIADLMGARLLTPHLSDLIHAQATSKITPQAQPWWKDGSLAYTRRLIEYDKIVEAQLGKASGLVSNEGKDWVLSNMLRAGRAANYGWHRAGQSPIQTVGTAHNLDHVDYSQLCRLVSRACKLDGMHVDLDQVLMDPELASAVTGGEGMLHTLDPRDAQPDTDPAPPPKPTPKPMSAVKQGDHPDVPLVQARNYTQGRREPVRLVVIHTAEMGLTKLSAENLASWAAGPSAPKASWHYAVDSDSVVQCCLEADTAWHAKQANSAGIGIELAARAKWTEANWESPEALDMLLLAAELVAGICRRHNIPIAKLSPAEYLAGAAGIIGHHDVTVAHKTPGGHWDPGPAFPWVRLLEMVRRAA